MRDYNDMTPRELNLAIEAYAERTQAEAQEQIVTSWLTAYYHRVKRMPKVDKEVEKLTTPKKRKQTDEEMYANLMGTPKG